MLIDSHAHLTHIAFQDDVRLILQRAQEKGVEAILNICTTPEEVEKGSLLSQEFPWVYTVAATTPHDAQELGAIHFPPMQAAIESGKLKGVGETGLDYHYYPDSKEIQQYFLRKYICLAKENSLPLVIHCREAFADLITILDADYRGKPAILHCFTGTSEEADQLIERGYTLSFSGIVTFKKSQELQAIAKRIPLNQLLIETDAPYLAPLPHRGKRNEPAFLIDTAQFLADLRGIPLATLAAATARNTRSLFNL